jgi:hypothetical protein
MVAQWALQDAKKRFSAVVEAALAAPPHRHPVSASSVRLHLQRLGLAGCCPLTAAGNPEGAPPTTDVSP